MEIKEELNLMLAVFQSKDFEHSYRQQNLDQDKRQAKFILIDWSSILISAARQITFRTQSQI